MLGNQSIRNDRNNVGIKLSAEHGVFPPDHMSDDNQVRRLTTHPVLLTQITPSTFRSAPASNLLVNTPTASPNPNNE